MKKLIFAFICLFLVVPCQAGIIYVDTNTPDNNDGSSWAKAYKYLQDALADANSNVDVNEIWVAQGIYTPDSNSADPNGSGDRTSTFQLINGVALYGGFPSGGGEWSNRDPNAYESILSGDLNGDDGPGQWQDNGENSYHVVTGSGTDTTAILDGFTITAGNATIYGFHYLGGGMFNYDSSPTVTNCIFTGNSVDDSGGGINNYNYSSPTVTNCTFSDNSAWGGGGMYNYNSSTTVTNCTFSGNWADVWGGGIYNSNSSPTLTNCTFSGNWADIWGGGMYNADDSDLNIANCILWGNAAGTNGAEIALIGPNSTVTVLYSDAQGGLSSVYVDPNCSVIWGLGNINADPCFVEPGYWADANDPNIVVEPNDPNAIWVDGDYHLLPDSPCIDSGDNNSVPADIHDLDGDGNTAEPLPFDLDGNPRVINGRIDMGAYETNYIQAAMKFTPQMLNCNSKGKYIKAHFILPEGFLPADADVNEPAMAEPMGAESEYIKVLGTGTGPVKLEICFDREAFCETITETGEVEITVIGSLTTGRYFYATDTIKIKPRR